MNAPLQLNGPYAQHMGELACPDCQTDLAESFGNADSAPELACASCGKRFPVLHGVPHFALHLQEQTETAQSFGFAWKAFWTGSFDKTSVFGLKASETKRYVLKSLGIEDADLAGKTFLDAGTGSGRIPMSLRDAACRVYAVDIHGSLNVVKDAIDSPSLRVHQADLLKLPFKDGFFDYVWSSGVIHHTPRPADAFTALARKVKPGGRLFVSVYGTMRHHYRLFRHLLPFTPRLPTGATYLIAALVGAPMYVAFNGALAAVRFAKQRQQPPYSVLGFQIEDLEPKSYRSIVLNLFDQLHPKFQHEHTPEEVAMWFERNGFRDVVATNLVGMVEMRGIKR